MGRDEHWAGDVCKEAVLLTSGDNTAVPASRTARLSRIRALIRSEQISSQAELARRLAGEGIVVSQGTLSRDLKDAGAVRGRDHLGNFQYSIPEGEHPSDVTTGLPAWNHLAKICHTLCTEVSCNDGAVVVKTPPGAAQYLGSAIDTYDRSSWTPSLSQGQSSGDNEDYGHNRNRNQQDEDDHLVGFEHP